MRTPDAAAREGALLVPRPQLSTLVVTGPDRASWLHAMLTCRVEDLPEGRGAHGLFLTKPGKLVAELLVLPAGDQILLGVPRASADALLEALRRFLIMEDAELAAAAPELAWMVAHGPDGARILAQLARGAGGHAAAVDLYGLGGGVAAVPDAALQAALAAGRHAGAVVGDAADLLRLRVERGVAEVGVDVGSEHTPHDASLERRAIDWDKGCYLGQEAVCMLEMRGRRKRRLALLALPGAELPAPGTPVTGAAGEPLGETRSAAPSARLGGVGVLAVLPVGASDPGARVLVAGREAVVVEPR